MVEIPKIILDSGWLAARSNEIEESGIELTTTDPPPGSAAPWMEAVVPGTVLATLVKNNVLPDPFYGLKNEGIIDIAKSGREDYTFWFFTTFQCKLSANQHAVLNFRAINYSAEVYLNGDKTVLPKGMFRRHSLDVTCIPHSGQNLLAVLVYPPEHPGKIPLEGGQGGDHEIGKDVAAQYVEGWDWVAPIRDRNTGIWDEVSLSVTGPVQIIDPHLASTFYDRFNRAYLHATTELKNKGSLNANCSLNIEWKIELEGDICLVERLHTQHLTIAPGEQVQFTFPEIYVYKPHLWWPNGMGKQYLYDVTITVDVNGYGESDSWTNPFGFRKIESYIDDETGGRLFKVNGQPIFIRGGNWIVSDGLLRLSKTRYETDIKFHADMNLNMIRCWGGGLAERPEFYHYCDIYGLLVWQEFWITGDVNGGYTNHPLDHELFMLCAIDTVKLLRNHPSLALWVGGNEQVPPDDINKALKNELKLHPYFAIIDETEDSVHNLSDGWKDPSEYLDGMRMYIQGSLSDGFADGQGGFTDGPYQIQYPESFFKDKFYNYGFNPEIGSVGMPVAATIRATMPPEGWRIPIFKKLPNGSDVYIEEIPNPIWEYHKYIPYSNPGKVHNQLLLYGVPTNLDDFCLQAQLVNYIQYRALLEGWNSHMWKKFTGVLIWKTQNPWTGLRGQFYDHLLDQTAGFYGCRCAAETIHVQLNLVTYFIEIVNNTWEGLSDVAVEVSVWDLEGSCPYREVHEDRSIPKKETVTIAEMKYPKTENTKPVYFLLLKLYNTSDDSIISRNFYWLHLPGGDYKLLKPYRNKRIPLKVTSKTSVKDSTYEIELQVQNTSKERDLKGSSLTYKNNFVARHGDQDFDMSSSSKPVIEGKSDASLLRRIFKSISSENDGLRVVEIGGADAGVAFFLHFSVHNSSRVYKDGEDSRILPVHYSDNYFSLVPGEVMAIKISFDVPPGVTPSVMLKGWNYNVDHAVL